MGGAVILTWVLGAIIIVLIVGGGVYAIVYHGKAGPDKREARQYQQAKADPNLTPLAEHVPSEPVAAAGGLAESPSPLQDPGPSGGQAGARPSGDRTAGPGRDPG